MANVKYVDCHKGNLLGVLSGAIHYYYDGKARFTSFEAGIKDLIIGIKDNSILSLVVNSAIDYENISITYLQTDVLNKRFGNNFERLVKIYIIKSLSDTPIRFDSDKKVEVICKPKEYTKGGITIAYMYSKCKVVKQTSITTELLVYSNLEEIQLELAF
jgi:hypothetical protein